jgi:hypothetical protein
MVHVMDTVQVNRCLSSTTPKKLSGLIPTNKAFAENVKIVHFGVHGKLAILWNFI